MLPDIGLYQSIRLFAHEQLIYKKKHYKLQNQCEVNSILFVYQFTLCNKLSSNQLQQIQNPLLVSALNRTEDQPSDVPLIELWRLFLIVNFSTLILTVNISVISCEFVIRFALDVQRKASTNRIVLTYIDIRSLKQKHLFQLLSAELLKSIWKMYYTNALQKRNEFFNLFVRANGMS